MKISKGILINELTDFINKNGYPKRIRLFFKKYGLKSSTTYARHLGGGLLDWIKLCGFELTEDEIYDLSSRGKSLDISKEDTIKGILKLQSSLNRPLMYDDFRGISKNQITMAVIKRYWGTMNKMKKELDLEIIQESMIDRSIPVNDIYIYNG